MPLLTNTEDNIEFDTQLQNRQCRHVSKDVDDEGATFHDAGINTVCMTGMNEDGIELHNKTGESCYAMVIFSNMGYFTLVFKYKSLLD